MVNKKSYVQSEGFIPAGLTAGDYLEQAVKLAPQKAALIFNNKQITYKQLDHSVNQLAESLLHLGIRHGDRVALLLPDGPELIIAGQAVLRIGAVKVPLDIHFREAEIRFALLHSKARAIIMISEVEGFSFVDLVDRLRSQFPALDHVIVKGRTNPEMIPLRQLLTGDRDAKNLVDKYLHDYPVEPDDVAAIIYCAGSPGNPRGVVHTHNTVYRLARASNLMAEVRDNEVWLAMMPLSSPLGVLYGEPCPVVSRTTLVLTDNRVPEQVLKSIQQYKVTTLTGMPKAYADLLRCPRISGYDLSSVRNINLGWEISSLEILSGLRNRFNCTLTISYGAPEYGHVTVSRLAEPPEKAGRISGKPVCGGVEVKIVNSYGRIVPRGEAGEIYVRSFGNALGYFEDPDGTERAFGDCGWMHVHDLGVMDEEGNIAFLGRENDIIVRAGRNIYPAEIESLLFAHPAVADACVVGCPDQELGERICAFIVPRQGVKEITRDEIAFFLSNKIAAYKIPDRVEVVDFLPAGAGGKVQKFRLCEMLTGEPS
ncbi:MAG: acyl--CoA ligase [Firmicutes bacterium]|nr:acyl--CoA ligase [Bacillota bacterium]